MSDRLAFRVIPTSVQYIKLISSSYIAMTSRRVGGVVITSDKHPHRLLDAESLMRVLALLYINAASKSIHFSFHQIFALSGTTMTTAILLPDIQDRNSITKWLRVARLCV